jgi:DNA gyrase subunit A
MKVHEIPQAGRTAKGKAIFSLLNLKPGDRVTGILSVRNWEEGWYIIQCTKKGIVKKTDLQAYSKPRPGGIIALKLDDHDELICASLTDGKKDIFIGTRNGLAIRFPEKEARPIGRASRGVRGIQLHESDEIVGMEVVDPQEESKSILTITERGYSKRTRVSDYRCQGRSGKGIINLKATERVGKIVAMSLVSMDEEIMVITDGGTLIRTSVNGIPVQGRNTQGVKTISVSEGEQVVGLTRLAEKEDGEDSDSEGSSESLPEPTDPNQE